MKYLHRPQDIAQLTQPKQSLWSLLILLSAYILLFTHSPSGISDIQTPQLLIKCIIALISARFFGMLINQLVDAPFDAVNPRTKSRLIASGVIDPKDSFAFALLCATLFITSAFSISTQAGLFSIPITFLIGTYSLAKRWTVLCHFYIGSLLGFVPICICIALSIPIPNWVFLLSVGSAAIVSASDIVYAFADIEVDQSLGLYSLPSRYGLSTSLKTVGVLYYLSTLSLAGIIYLIGMPILFHSLPLYFGARATYNLIELTKEPRKNNLQIFTYLNRIYCILLFAISIGDYIWVAML